MIRNTYKFSVLDHEIILDSYVLEGSVNRDAVLIFPGGGYQDLSVEREGDSVALAYLEYGVNAFVLQYAVGDEYKYPSHLTDASYAMCYLKDHAKELGIDKNRIFTVGFSAGGHLSGSMAVLHKDPDVLAYLGISKGDNKPCGSILCYPVVSANVPTHHGSFEHLAGKCFAQMSKEEKDKLSLDANVDSDSAPAFIWHTSLDKGVPMLGSLRLAEAYYMLGMPVSLHIYPYGDHGIALATEKTSCGNSDWIQPLAAEWVGASVAWMKTVKALDKQ